MEYSDFVWIFIAVISIIIEGATLGLATIWFAFGALIAWIAQIIGFDQTTQIFVFLIVSIVLLIFTRPIAIKYLRIGKTRTNADSLIGDTGIVIKKIVNIDNVGQVKINGQIWSASSINDNIIDEGKHVIVKEIKGVKLRVEEKNN